jgi:hypothetical protein
MVLLNRRRVSVLFATVVCVLNGKGVGGRLVFTQWGMAT